MPKSGNSEFRNSERHVGDFCARDAQGSINDITRFSISYLSREQVFSLFSLGSAAKISTINTLIMQPKLLVIIKTILYFKFQLFI